MIRPTVLLFDLDGTLVRTGGAGRRAMRRALARELDAPDALAGVSFGGRTDRWILRTAFERVGRVFDEAGFAQVTSTYLAYLDEELRDPKGYRVLPAVPEVVEACANFPATALGLGTGNIEAAAYAKLGPSGLAPAFAFGGFGSDAEDRGELVATGFARGAAALGVAPEEARRVIIGDTTRDVDAAKAVGALCLAVGTGGEDPEALAARGADLALPTLAGPEALAFLRG